MPNLTKTDLINQIAAATGVSRKDTTAVLEKLGNEILAATGAGKTVITGFGRFIPKTRAARIGRNPATGEPVDIPAKATVSFKAAAAKS